MVQIEIAPGLGGRWRQLLDEASTTEFWRARLEALGPWLRRTRRAHRAFGQLAIRRLSVRPEIARTVALGAAALWLMGAFFFGGAWLAVNALAALWAVYVWAKPNPAFL